MRARAFAAASLVLLLAGCGGHRRAAPTTVTATTRKPVVRRVAPPLRRLSAVGAGRLPAPVQDAAAAPYAGGAVLLGGLTSADTSTDGIVVATRAGARDVGRLSVAFHDSAAVSLGRLTYAFGGGNGIAQLDAIVRVDPRTGADERVGSLPSPSSDQAAAALGGTAYVVGGFDGTRWLDTIVAWRPGHAARVVAHLPHPVRYAAVAAAGGRIVIAGGSLESGAASDAIYAYEPGGKVTRIGRLPAPTTHAAAAAIGGIVYVVGGRGATLDTPTARIVAVDPVRRRIRGAGTLPEPLSDLAAVTSGDGILLAGGHGAAGTVAAVTQLLPGAHATHTRVLDVYAADRAGDLSPAVRGAKPYVYVPNSDSGTVDVIDQRTFKVVRHFGVGA
jgi:hypothetical protein